MYSASDKEALSLNPSNRRRYPPVQGALEALDNEASIMLESISTISIRLIGVCIRLTPHLHQQIIQIPAESPVFERFLTIDHTCIFHEMLDMVHGHFA